MEPRTDIQGLRAREYCRGLRKKVLALGFIPSGSREGRVELKDGVHARFFTFKTATPAAQQFHVVQSEEETVVINRTRQKYSRSAVTVVAGRFPVGLIKCYVFSSSDPGLQQQQPRQ